MGSKHQRGLFDFEDRMREIGAKDPLARLHEVVDWEAFRGPIEKTVVPEPKEPGGRPRFDAVIMFKTLVARASERSRCGAMRPGKDCQCQHRGIRRNC